MEATMNYKSLLGILILTASSGAVLAQSGFLSDYDGLEPMPSAAGSDLVYVAPGAYQRIARYTAVLVDQPEIHFSADSEYRGMKPEDIEALAETVRQAIRERLSTGGYAIVEQAGPNVLFVRVGLTDLYLKKKRRRIMQYTPVGALAKAGRDAIRDTLDKVDIIEMSLEAELADSQSGDVLGALVVAQGAAEGEKEERMDLDQLTAMIGAYADRLRCRLDNAKLPETQWVDCLSAQ
jgi:hypothetical protein